MENTYDLAITTPSYGYDHTIVRHYILASLGQINSITRLV